MVGFGDIPQFFNKSFIPDFSINIPDFGSNMNMPSPIMFFSQMPPFLPMPPIVGSVFSESVNLPIPMGNFNMGGSAPLFNYGAASVPTLSMPPMTPPPPLPVLPMASASITSNSVSEVTKPTPTQTSSQVETVSNPVENSSEQLNHNAINTKGQFIKGKGKGTQYGPAFLKKVKQVAKEINCDYRDLLGIMNSESKINAHQPCLDKSSTAYGLIQMNDAAARGIGITPGQLRNSDPIQQLDYVKKYYLNWRKIKNYSPSQKLTAAELYSLTYTPAFVKPDSDVLCSKGSKEYKKNKIFDSNKDGVITKSEMGARVRQYWVNDNTFLS